MYHLQELTTHPGNEGGVTSAPTHAKIKKTTLTATHPLLTLQLPLLLLDKQGLPLIFEKLVGLGLELRLFSCQRLARGLMISAVWFGLFVCKGCALVVLLSIGPSSPEAASNATCVRRSYKKEREYHTCCSRFRCRISSRSCLSRFS